jgi:hypothetical protein
LPETANTTFPNEGRKPEVEGTKTPSSSEVMDLVQRLATAVRLSLLDHGRTHGPNVETYTIPLHDLDAAIRAGLAGLPRALSTHLKTVEADKSLTIEILQHQLKTAQTERDRARAANTVNSEAMFVMQDRALKAEAQLAALQSRVETLTRALERAQHDLLDLADGERDLAPAIERIDSALTSQNTGEVENV